ncbi:MAG: cation:proton antiporter [Bacteroidetes bacterium]|nr:cation:proton antiporter [Bacteroidota bacterium]MCH8523463.1 cation:proton antiporter [Balneolales bacterium]
MPSFNLESLPIQNPVLIVAIVMLIILISPLVFRRLRIPGLVGIILAGTIVGPSVTGLLDRDATIILLGTVGLLYLMFMAGLSIDLNQFNKLRNRSITFGFISFSLPMLFSYLVGPAFLGYSVATSLLLGAIVGSHTLLAYPIANRLGITKNTAVTMTMGGTMVTDLLSLFVLALVVGSMDQGITLSFLGSFGSSVAIFLAVSLIVIPRLGRWFFRTFPKENDAEYTFLVAILFVNAWFAELAGLAPIIGAFLAGLLLNRLVPDSSPLMNRVQFVGNALFIPFFLISVGMLVDVSVLIQAEVWIKALTFAGLVYAGKYIAAKISQFFYKHSNAESWTIFGLSTPQAAATLAVTLIGFDVGLFDEMAVNAVVILILITCLTGPWVVERFGRIVAVEESNKQYKAGDAPQRIMVPLANPQTAEALMDIAFAMRDKTSTENVFPLTVVRDGNNVSSQVADSEKMLSHAVIYAAGADIPVSPLTRIDMNIANGINRAIKERRITNVIIGWNGENSARQQIFGGVLDQLLEQSREMIMVCKIEDKISTNEHIVLAIPPFAGLEPGFPESMRYIKILANQIGANLTIVAAEERLPYIKEVIDETEPEVTTSYHGISSWGKLINALDELLEDTDMFILHSSREGTISWRPGLDRLPGIIVNRYPKNNFIAVYPSEIDEASSTTGLSNAPGIAADNAYNMLRAGNITLNLTNGSTRDMVAKLIRSSQALDEEKLDSLSQAVIDNSLEYTPEIVPGVAILDAHSTSLGATQVYIGISKEGVKIPKTSGLIHVLVVILNPNNIGIDVHYKRLNAVARMFRGTNLVDALLSAQTPEDILQILKKADYSNEDGNNNKTGFGSGLLGTDSLKTRD